MHGGRRRPLYVSAAGESGQLAPDARQFIRTLLWIAGVFSGLFVALATMSGIPNLWGGAAAVGSVFGITLGARALAGRRPVLAVNLVGYAILVHALAQAYFLPFGGAALAVAVILAAAWVLPYLAGRALRAFFAASLLATTAMTAVLLGSPHQEAIAPPIAAAVILLAVPAVTFLVLLLLWQFSNRLRALLASEASARRSAEEGAALLDSVFTAAPVGLSFVDEGLRYVRINSALAEINGCPPEAHIGRTVEEVIPELAPVVGPRYEAALAGESTLEIEVSGKTPARPDVQRDWLVSYYPVQLGERILGAGAVVLDVTARKSAERSMRFLAEASRALSSSLDPSAIARRVAELAVPALGDQCLVFTLDPHDVLQPAGRAPATAEQGELDQLERRLLASPAREVLLAATRASHAHALPGIFPAAEAIAVPLVAHGRNVGLLFLVRRTAGRSYDDEELTIAEDLGRRGAAALENARLYASSREAVRVRDDFISVASHELKTPLTALRLQIDGLVRMLEPASVTPRERLARTVATLDRSVDRLDRLVNDLLDVSRISSGLLDLRIELVDWASVLEEATARMAGHLAEARCTLSVQAEGPVVGAWDRLRIEQVTGNLLSNAVKYGAGQAIDVALLADEDTATLQVRDRGIGIAAEDHERIFERFERAVSIRSYGGFGLGLWIVKRVVARLGGTVQVLSQPGSGATFTVTLPRRQPAEPAGGPALVRPG